MTDGLPFSDFNREEICRSTVHAAVDISTDGEVVNLRSAGINRLEKCIKHMFIAYRLEISKAI